MEWDYPEIGDKSDRGLLTGWQYYQPSQCFYQFSGITASWDEAKNWCAGNNEDGIGYRSGAYVGHLAVPATEAEALFMSRFAGIEKGRPRWIGVSNAESSEYTSVTGGARN